jgi:hypothetical protein
MRSSCRVKSARFSNFPGGIFLNFITSNQTTSPMKLVKFLPLAAVALVLNACSSEPSDWRPEQKVSDDMVAPGTRVTDNFDQNTEYAPNQAKGAAITKPISSGTELEGESRPSAEGAMSSNSEAALRSHSKTDGANVNAKPSQEDTTGRGHMIQR